jgi:hypothetical protein
MAKNKLEDLSFGDRLKEFATNAVDPDQLYGIISARQINKYASGARTILKVNGKIVGFAFSISWNINTEHKDIFTIDEYFPADTAPSLIQVSGTIGAFHIPGNGPTQREMQANMKSFMNHKYIEIEARDTQTDELLFYTQRAYITNRSQSINSGELSKMQLSFRSIGWYDDLDLARTKVEQVDTEEGAMGGATSRFEFPKLPL